MRRQLVAQAADFIRHGILHPLMQQAQLLLDRIELRLLANYHLVECIDQVFGKRKLGFEFGEAGLCPSRKAVG